MKLLKVEYFQLVICDSRLFSNLFIKSFVVELRVRASRPYVNLDKQYVLYINDLNLGEEI
ncbi:hypothetical protein BpHYR1_014574 [Brachionus plicatilis]|uniref:Uncharacterized protein n=1 Tax=Brachionus plicatilis TaxID=10195 RepID=A0A3M7RIW1_BRAPC|nr:hypothetical protein BpHYR1_014574 [Brachionus plicatilis]